MRLFKVFILLCFFSSTLGPLPVQAQGLVLPKAPGVEELPTVSAIVKGLTIHPENPAQFDFIVEPLEKSVPQALLKEQSLKMIKYFLASLTVPEKDMWVNLSPYEKNRIIPEAFGQTLMGRDLLAQDYILKKMTASLIHPDTALGQEFWNKIYTQAKLKYGTTQIPINTFNKVWIMPDKATVWEHGKSAFVVERHLKVMLEEDYLATQKGAGSNSVLRPISGKELVPVPNIIRSIVIPALEKEVNQGASFAQLRQIYNAMILATWFKKRLKDSLLGTVYVDKNKINGVGYSPSVILSPKGAKDLKVSLDSSASPQNDIESIYHQYLSTFKKGVFNFIKEEPDPTTGQMIPRKYFSGGMVGLDRAELVTIDAAIEKLPPQAVAMLPSDQAMKVTFNTKSIGHEKSSKEDQSMFSKGKKEAARRAWAYYSQFNYKYIEFTEKDVQSPQDRVYRLMFLHLFSHLWFYQLDFLAKLEQGKWREVKSDLDTLRSNLEEFSNPANIRLKEQSAKVISKLEARIARLGLTLAKFEELLQRVSQGTFTKEDEVLFDQINLTGYEKQAWLVHKGFFTPEVQQDLKEILRVFDENYPLILKEIQPKNRFFDFSMLVDHEAAVDPMIIHRQFVDQKLDEIQSILQTGDKKGLGALFNEIQLMLSGEARDILSEQDYVMHLKSIHPAGVLMALSIYILDKANIKERISLLDDKLLKKLQTTLNLFNEHLDSFNQEGDLSKTGRLDIPLLFNLNLAAPVSDRLIKAYKRLASVNLFLTSGPIQDEIVALSLFFMKTHLSLQALNDFDLMDYELLVPEIEYAVNRILSGGADLSIQRLEFGLTVLLSSIKIFETNKKDFVSYNLRLELNKIFNLLKPLGYRSVRDMIQGQYEKDQQTQYPVVLWSARFNSKFVFYYHPRLTFTEILFDYWSSASQEFFIQKGYKKRAVFSDPVVDGRSEKMHDIAFHNRYQESIEYWRFLDAAMDAQLDTTASFAEREENVRMANIQLARSRIDESLNEIQGFLRALDYGRLPQIYEKIESRLSSKECKQVLQEQVEQFDTISHKYFLSEQKISQSHPLGALIALSIDILDKTDRYKTPILDEQLLNKLHETIVLYNQQLKKSNTGFFSSSHQFGKLDIPLLFNLNMAFFTHAGDEEYLRLAKATTHIIPEGPILDDIVALSLFLMGVHLAKSVNNNDTLDFELVEAEVDYALRRISNISDPVRIQRLTLGLVKFLFIAPELDLTQLNSKIKEKLTSISQKLHQFGFDKIERMLGDQKQKDKKSQYPLMGAWSLEGAVNNLVFFIAAPDHTATEVFFQFSETEQQAFLVSIKFLIREFKKTGLLVLPTDAESKKLERNILVDLFYRKTVNFWTSSDFSMNAQAKDKQDNPIRKRFEAYVRETKAFIESESNDMRVLEGIEKRIRKDIARPSQNKSLLVKEQYDKLMKIVRWSRGGFENLSLDDPFYDANPSFAHPFFTLDLLALFIWDQASRRSGAMSIDRQDFRLIQDLIDSYNKHREFYNKRIQRDVTALDLPMLFYLALAAGTDYEGLYKRLCSGFKNFSTGAIKDQMAALNLLLMGVHFEHGFEGTDDLDMEVLFDTLDYAVKRLTKAPRLVTAHAIEIGLGKLLYAIAKQHKYIDPQHLLIVTEKIAPLQKRNIKRILNDIRQKDQDAPLSLIRLHFSMNTGLVVFLTNGRLPSEVLLDFWNPENQKLIMTASRQKKGVPNKYFDRRCEETVEFWNKRIDDAAMLPSDQSMEVAINSTPNQTDDAMSAQQIELDRGRALEELIESTGSFERTQRYQVAAGILSLKFPAYQIMDRLITNLIDPIVPKQISVDINWPQYRRNVRESTLWAIKTYLQDGPEEAKGIIKRILEDDATHFVRPDRSRIDLKAGHEKLPTDSLLTNLWLFIQVDKDFPKEIPYFWAADIKKFIYPDQGEGDAVSNILYRDGAMGVTDKLGGIDMNAQNLDLAMQEEQSEKELFRKWINDLKASGSKGNPIFLIGGHNGARKTTMAKSFGQFLRNQGYSVVVIHTDELFNSSIMLYKRILRNITTLIHVPFIARDRLKQKARLGEIYKNVQKAAKFKNEMDKLNNLSSGQEIQLDLLGKKEGVNSTTIFVIEGGLSRTMLPWLVPTRSVFVRVDPLVQKMQLFKRKYQAGHSVVRSVIHSLASGTKLHRDLLDEESDQYNDVLEIARDGSITLTRDGSMNASSKTLYSKFFSGGGIIRLRHFLYDLESQRLVSKNSRGTVGYFGSGVDMSHAILLTDGEEFDMIDQLVPTRQEFEEYEWDGEEEKKTQRKYADNKYAVGYGVFDDIKGHFIDCLVAELKSMGIKKKDVKLIPLHNDSKFGFSISFKKKFPGQTKAKNYTFNFIRSSTVTKFDTQKKYNIVLQRAGWKPHTSYPFEDMMRNVRPYLAQGAQIIINPYDYIAPFDKPTYREVAISIDGEILGYKAVESTAAMTNLESDLSDEYRGKGYGFIQKVFDLAMHIQNKRNLGGIDMNAENLDLAIKQDFTGTPLSATRQDWAQLSIQGLEPQIIKIESFDSKSLFSYN